MTSPSVTIRHTRHAIALLLTGAMQNIEPDSHADLVDEVITVIADLGIVGTFITRADAMVSEMHEILGNEDCPDVVRELLAKHDMLP